MVVAKATPIKFALVRVSCKNAEVILLSSKDIVPITALVFGDENVPIPVPLKHIPIMIIIGLLSGVNCENITMLVPVKLNPAIEIHLVPILSDKRPDNGLVIAIQRAPGIIRKPAIFGS